MQKTLTESIREILTKIDEAAGQHYDLELEVENWDDSVDGPDYRTLGIDYKITGRHRPATWGYHGGEPEEYPELDEIDVYDVVTGQPLTDLPDYLYDQIEDAIWKDAERRKDDSFEPPDNYDRF